MTTADDKRYAVAQTPRTGAWVHYLCGWCGSVDEAAGDWNVSPDDRHQVPIFLSDRGQALVFDATTARRVADQLGARYRDVVQTYVEELP